MKIWTIKTTIETDDDWTKKEILEFIDEQANIGDGMYISVDRKAKVKLMERVLDKDEGVK